MNTPISPAHYKGFSNGAEVIDISENLTSNGGQAVQYIARATRLDGNVKGNPAEDITKAIWFCERELGRLATSSDHVVDAMVHDFGCTRAHDTGDCDTPEPCRPGVCAGFEGHPGTCADTFR